MIYLHVHLVANEGADLEAIAGHLATLGKNSREEQGCERWEAYQAEEDPRRFFLVEWWATAEDLDRHRTMPHFEEVYKGKVLPMVTRVPFPSKLIG